MIIDMHIKWSNNRYKFFGKRIPLLSGRVIFVILSIFALLLNSCNSSTENFEELIVEDGVGCDGQTYPEPSESKYVLPFPFGKAYMTGLTNCSSSYHSSGNPDQYAFDFNMPVGSQFCAARGGVVYRVVEDKASSGGGTGNYVVIDHGDRTFGLYYHSPKDGIHVSVGDNVKQGDILGETGRSGLAGYPHLHFIVVKNSPNYPYSGLAISFKNSIPSHKALISNTQYKAGSY